MSGGGKSLYNPDVAALGFLAAVALVVLWPVTLGDKVLLPADLLLRMEPFRAHAREYDFERVQNPILDAIQQFYPWRKFAGEQARVDQVPLWNPYMSCGAPFLANNQAAAFYPETWLWYVMSAERAFGWAAFLYMVLAGGFMYWYLRTIGCRAEAAVLGALPFMLSGFAIGWMTFPTLRSVPVWLPLMLVGHEQMVRGHRGPWWLLSGLAVGMQFLVGHLHISFFMLLVFGGYVVFRAAWGHEGRRQWGTVGYGFGALALGALMGAAQLTPVLELVRLSSRQLLSWEHIKGFGLVPASLLTGLMPDIFGNPVDYNYWGEIFITKGRAYLENVWYVGIAPLMLAVAALALWRKRIVWFWLGAVVVGGGLAWGTWLCWGLYELVPPLRTLPGISRAVIIVDIGIAVLAGLGAEAIFRTLGESGRERIVKVVTRTGIAIIGIGVAGGLGVWFFTGQLEQGLPGIGGYTLAQVGIFLALAVASALLIGLTTHRRELAIGLLLLVVAVDLGRCAVRFIPMVPREYLHIETQALAAMKGERGDFRMMSLSGPGGWITRMPPNVPMAFGLECVESSDSLTVPWYDGLVNVARGGDGQLWPDLPLWDALNTKYALTPRELAGRWKLIDDHETHVYENVAALPRFYSPSQVVWVKSYELARRWMSAIDYLPREELVMVGSGAAEQGEFAGGRVLEWSPNVVTVEAAAGGRWWVLADTCYPGWHAYCEGAELQIVPANHSLRGVRAPQGGGRIRFVYYPAGYALGAFLTALSMGILGFVLAYDRRRRGGRHVEV